jgi:tetratricopeptide (TPR) repeat protein
MSNLRRLLLGAFYVVALLAQDQAPAGRTETLQHAAAFIQQGDLASAENALQSLLKYAPHDPLALNLLGVVRLRQQNSAEAANLFRQAIQTGHKVAGPHINLALIDGADRPLEAIAELREALAIAPGDKQAVSLLRAIAKQSTMNAMQSGSEDKAMAVLLKACSVLPGDPELLYDSGLVAYESGSYPTADRSLTEALKLRPGYPEATYALARTYLAENLAKPAEDQMRTYLAEKPNDPTAQYGLGYILMAEQRIEEAKQAFERSLALQPDQTESLFQLGEIAAQQGQDSAARDDFTKVLVRDPHHGGALTALGVLAYRTARYGEAKADFERAVESAPGYQKAHYYYALTLSRLGQSEQAEREFTIANRLQKQHGEEHHLPAAQP